ncbi:MAG: DUF1905 domain-containing protein [Bacteroidetes bacterium]|nr:DUF1905 domain-containing protein [Bacteroidota bacterium]
MKYSFTARVWQCQSINGPGWHFVSLPEDYSVEIRSNLGNLEQGWGRMKAKAQINQSIWDTSIWFDTKKGVYLLALNALIRKKENINLNDELEISVWL